MIVRNPKSTNMKTKLFLSLFAVLFLFLQSANGQANYNYNRNYYQDDFFRNEVHLEYGVITTQSTVIAARRLLSDISARVLDAILEDLGAKGLDYTRDSYGGTRGAIGLGYNRYFAPRWSVGVMGNYHAFKATIDFENGYQTELKDRFYTLLVRTDYRWVNQPVVQLYSGISLGGTWWRSAYENPDIKFVSTSFFNMQVTPIGIRVGKQVGGFLEFGLGSNGLLVGGVSAKF